jgi:formamidopyrimidine-DNA glycosylase
MPELPEVETVVRGLRPIAVGRTIARVDSRNAPPASIVVSASLKKRPLDTILPGHTVEAINRRGKNILIELSDGLTLWAHLKMTGKFLQADPQAPRDKHDLVVFDLGPSGDGARTQLRFNDYRRFGRLRLYPNHELWEQPALRDLGPEPLEIKAAGFVELCRARSRMIKPALLDQSFIAGIGNIYADESLYLSRIHPSRLTSTLSSKKLIELHGHIQRMLKKSIRLMGTTVISYAGVDGRSGSFQKMLVAYGHEGEPCGRCGAIIVREKMGARSAHFCPRCQRPPR